MNIRYDIKWLLVIIMGTALLTACQEEKIEIKLPPPGSTISSTSSATVLIAQVTTRDGSFDNIIDKSSCISLVFPVTIKTNSQTITLTSMDDLDDIEDLFDDSGDDDVEFVFPIKVKLTDHTEVTLKNETEYNNLIGNCKSDDDIECIDFKYPIQLDTYDANNQVAGSVTINNDEELYNFLRQLKKDEIVGFKFPVTLIKSNGSEITVNDFDDLEDIIEDAEDDCDEDDDNDYNDDDVDDAAFASILINGKWQVESFIDAGADRTAEFAGYDFTFNSDNSVNAVKTTNTIPGIWNTSGSSGTIELQISMSGNDPFDDISEDWTVVTFSTTGIRLEKGDDDDDDDKRILVFKKI